MEINSNLYVKCTKLMSDRKNPKREAERKRMSIDVLEMSEIQWPARGTTRMENSTLYCSSSNDNKTKWSSDSYQKPNCRIGRAVYTIKRFCR